MLGTYVRAAFSFAGGGFLGVFMSWVIEQFLPMIAGPTNDGILYRSLAGIGENAILLFLVAGTITLLARANVERARGGV